MKQTENYIKIFRRDKILTYSFIQHLLNGFFFSLCVGMYVWMDVCVCMYVCVCIYIIIIIMSCR